MVEIYLDDGDQEQPISSPLSSNNMKQQMCAALAEPVEELRRSVSFFREGAKATIKAATTEESYFQSWDMDSMRELLAQNNVQVRGASVAPHEYFVMICNEVFGDDHNNMPSKPELPATYEEFQERDNAALLIQNAYFGYKSSVVTKTLLAQNRNRSFEYSPNVGCNPAESDSEQNLVHPQTRKSLMNAEASMFDCSLANNPAPHKFVKMDEKELDEEIEIEWRKPSWKFAKRFGAESRPHHAGGEMLPYDYKTATLGRHCIFSSCGEQLDLWNEGQTSEFAQFGSGVTNYFKFLKWCTWIMFLLSILHTPILFINMIGTSMQYENYFTTAITTIGNLGSADEVAEIKIPGCTEGDFQQDICSIQKNRLAMYYSLVDATGTIVVVLGLLWLMKFERQEANNLSRSTVKASDYTICVRNIPENTTEAEIKAHFAKVTGEAIASVSLAWANAQEIQLYFKRGELMKKRFICIQKIRHEKTMHNMYGEGACDKKHLAKMLKERKKLTKMIQIEDGQRMRKVNVKPNAIQAFVTFRSEEGGVKAMKAYQLSWIRSTLFCFYPRRLKFRGKKLYIDKAPEPSTILWENLEHGYFNRMCRKGVTNTVALSAILVSVVFTFMARDFQNKTLAKSEMPCPEDFTDAPENEQLSIVSSDESLLHCYCTNLSILDQGRSSECYDYLKSNLESMAMSYGAAATICIMNVFFTWLMTKAGSFEKHHSVDRMEASIMFRVFLLKFINTGCLVLLFNQAWLQHMVNIEFEDKQPDFGVQWYETSGMSIFIVMCVNIVSPHVMPLLQYKKFKSRIKQIESNLTDTENTSDAQKIWYTQDELNQVFIGPHFQLNYRYAQILVNFYICWMYSISMPIMTFLGAVIFYVSYWVDKFLFCRFYRTPPMYSDDMGKFSTKLIGVSVVVHLMMSIWMLGNQKIFRSKSFKDDSTYEPIPDIPGESPALQQVHLLPILSLLIVYILAVSALQISKVGGSQSLKLLKCLTCRSDGAANALMKQKKRKYIRVDYSRAIDRGMIKGLASYNILHNPKYQEAFAVSKEFAKNKTRLSHITGLNTNEGSLCAGIMDVSEEEVSEKFSSKEEQIMFQNI
mmetsp:Transcript_9056/g.13500  ORF Transcript_9056/g.13500 Transcript_9056/m.13500 type:complete len:1091 (+) Transcript_9056:834-4106(+)